MNGLSGQEPPGVKSAKLSNNWQHCATDENQHSRSSRRPASRAGRCGLRGLPAPSRGGRDLRGRGEPEGGRPKVGAALPCPALRGSPRLPAHGVRLAGLRLRRAGGHGRCRGLRQGRQRPFSSCRSSVWRLSGTGRLPAVQRSEECVAFPRGVWHLVCCDGNEILQLQKGNARDNCRCQFTDGWTAWIADDGKNLLSHKSASGDLKTHD